MRCIAVPTPLSRKLHVKRIRQMFIVAGHVVLCAATASAQASVTCKDGAKSKGGRGACSRHGGVAPAGETKAEMKATKTEERKDAKADKKVAAVRDEKKEEKKEAKREENAEDRLASGAIAECKDHAYSHAKTHKGACASHGGVLKFLDGKK